MYIHRQISALFYQIINKNCINEDTRYSQCLESVHAPPCSIANNTRNTILTTFLQHQHFYIEDNKTLQQKLKKKHRNISNFSALSLYLHFNISSTKTPY